MAQFTGQANKRSSRRRGLPGEQGTQTGEGTAGPATGFLIGGKYRIDGLLGQGGMGAIYRATHMVSGKRVAVKWMLPAAGATEELAERFVREARATARIDHPNVVDVYDVGAQDGSIYLVMELLHGESLGERLERGPMGTVEAVGILMHALRAVAAAHAEGVIHRDLKPDNIFLCQSPDGEPREPKVLDFGISKVAAGNDMRDMSLTQSGTVMGTPFYMSPEQVRGLRDVDERGDVYAFGVILYEMLSGAFPFDAETYNELILKIVTEEPTPLLSLCKDVDPILASVIARAMARDRERRHRDIAALAADLEPFAGGVSFRRTTTVPGAPAVSQPVPRGTTARKAAEQDALANAPSRKRSWIAVCALLALAAIGLGAWLFSEPEPPHARPAVIADKAVLAPAPQAMSPPPAPVTIERVATAEPSASPEPASAKAAAPSALPQVKNVPAAPEPPSSHATRNTRRGKTVTAASGDSSPTAASQPRLAADWDERLPTGTQPASRAKPVGKSPAGELRRSDL
jgi:eukaryotic-like serine/threonine-protein kinase